MASSQTQRSFFSETEVDVFDDEVFSITDVYDISDDALSISLIISYIDFDFKSLSTINLRQKSCYNIFGLVFWSIDMGTVYTLRAFVSSAEAVADDEVAILTDWFSEPQVEATDSVHISVYTANVLYTYDGATDPAFDTTGHLIEEDSERIINGVENIKKLRFIGATGGANVYITLSTYNVTDPE